MRLFLLVGTVLYLHCVLLLLLLCGSKTTDVAILLEVQLHVHLCPRLRLRDQEVVETAAASVAAFHCGLNLVFDLAAVVDDVVPLVHEASTVVAWTVQRHILAWQ